MRSCHDLYKRPLAGGAAGGEHIVDRFDLSGAIALITGSSRGIGRTSGRRARRMRESPGSYSNGKRHLDSRRRPRDFVSQYGDGSACMPEPSTSPRSCQVARGGELDRG